MPLTLSSSAAGSAVLHYRNTSLSQSPHLGGRVGPQAITEQLAGYPAGSHSDRGDATGPTAAAFLGNARSIAEPSAPPVHVHAPSPPALPLPALFREVGAEALGRVQLIMGLEDKLAATHRALLEAVAASAARSAGSAAAGAVPTAL
jgi:hypothetical protein